MPCCLSEPIGMESYAETRLEYFMHLLDVGYFKVMMDRNPLKNNPYLIATAFCDGWINGEILNNY